MHRVAKKRNKKWDPQSRFDGLTRSEYILKPWKHLLPVKTEEEEPVDEEVVEETEVSVGVS